MHVKRAYVYTSSLKRYPFRADHPKIVDYLFVVVYVLFTVFLICCIVIW